MNSIKVEVNTTLGMTVVIKGYVFAVKEDVPISQIWARVEENEGKLYGISQSVSCASDRLEDC